MDSIRDNTKLEDMARTLKMELDADIEDRICIVLVEGKDDKTFVKRVFEKDVVCYESFSGKEGLTELLEHEYIQNNRIIAIRDKDYANVTEFHQRMFWHDTCCMETMMLSSEEVTEGIFTAFYKGNKVKEDFLLNAMRELAPLSALREENEIHGYGIDFKKIHLGECIDETTEKLDIDSLWTNIDQTKVSKQACITKAQTWTNAELFEKTNGHDLCKFLGKICKTGKKDLGEERLRDALLCSYRKSDFIFTYLYEQLNNYQTTHQLSIV